MIAAAGSLFSAWISLRLVRQSKHSQRNPGEADGEFLQRPPACDGLSHSFRNFVEFIVHNFPFVLFVFGFSPARIICRNLNFIL
jgi:hypothetical protein